jgi:hypothetical protein
MPRIKNNGLTQHVRFRATAVDGSGNITGAFTGSVEGEALPGAVVVFSQNKTTGWDDATIETPVVKWSAAVGIWDAEISPSAITQNGDAELHVSGTGMITVSIPLEVGNTGGGGMGQVLESTDYDFDASAKTITLLGSFADTELPQIMSIKNMSKGHMTIYDCNDPRTTIAYTAPTISWTPVLKYKGTDFEDTDELQIIINKV